MNPLLQVGKLYGYLGYRALNGDINAVKFLYQNTWKESPPLIRTIYLLQEDLTPVNLNNPIYSPEFLYYWAMLCIGEQSNLICKDLGTAEWCLNQIKADVPKAHARLAYIHLLQSTEPVKSEENILRISTLRRYAGRQDLFSQIVLSKIVFYQFLNEDRDSCSEPPFKALSLLELPCWNGHPVAIRFRKDMLCHLNISDPTDRDEGCINPDILFDFETSANMQIVL